MGGGTLVFLKVVADCVALVEASLEGFEAVTVAEFGAELRNKMMEGAAGQKSGTVEPEAA